MKKRLEDIYGFVQIGDKLREKYPFEWYLKNECKQRTGGLSKEDMEFFKGAYDNFIGVKVQELKNKGYRI